MMTEQSWNALISQHALASGGFLQSWAWGEFQKSQGRDVRRIVSHEGERVFLAQAVKLTAPLGISYWLVPKGPLGNASQEFSRKTLLHELGRDVDYIRTESFLRLPKTVPGKEMHPQTTRLLDLSHGYDVVLNDFNAKTRYNTRLGRKKGVETAFVGIDRFDDFVTLMGQTAERDEFHLHEMSYYKAMLESLIGAEECNVKLALATRENIPLAVALTVDSFGVRTYLHGASGNQMRELKAPQVLQDFIIHDACDAGMFGYDFWGIAPPGADERHPWWGISRFKEGFGGYVYGSAGTFDIPVHSAKYGLYRVARFAKKLLAK